MLSGVVQRSVCNTTWVAALTGLTCRRGHSSAIHHVNPMKGGVLLCSTDQIKQRPQLPSACHFMKRRRLSFIVSQNWIPRQDVLRIPTSNTTEAKDFPIPKLLYSYSTSQTPKRVPYPRAVCIPLTLGYLSSPFLLPEGCPDVLECSNRTREKESIMWCGSVMEYHLPAGVREEDVVQCSSVMKKRRRKMNRHKYKKWRKKMRFLRRSLGK